jgi:hypothetical protein
VHQVGDQTKVILRCTVNQPSKFEEMCPNKEVLKTFYSLLELVRTTCIHELGSNLFNHLNCKKNHQTFTMGESSDIRITAQLVIFISDTDPAFMLVTILLIV